jgi:hypothetical protein
LTTYKTPETAFPYPVSIFFFNILSTFDGERPSDFNIIIIL